MFKYLKHQLSKVRSQFVKTFPKLDDWKAKEWYRFHLKLEAKASEHHLWVMAYYLQSPKCKEPRGFVIADPDDDQNADLYSDYLECIGPWNAQLLTVLSLKVFFPTWPPSARLKIQSKLQANIVKILKRYTHTLLQQT